MPNYCYFNYYHSYLIYWVIIFYIIGILFVFGHINVGVFLLGLDEAEIMLTVGRRLLDEEGRRQAEATGDIAAIVDIAVVWHLEGRK